MPIIPNNLDLFRGKSERGRFGIKQYKIVFPVGTAAAQILDIETVNIGAGSVNVFVDCGASVKDYDAVLSVSANGTDKTAIKHKELDGTETGPSAVTISATTKKHLIASYADYPQIMSSHLFHLSLTPSAAPAGVADVVTVTVTLK